MFFVLHQWFHLDVCSNVSSNVKKTYILFVRKIHGTFCMWTINCYIDYEYKEHQCKCKSIKVEYLFLKVMELSLIMDYFTCESKDEILELVDLGGGGHFPILHLICLLCCSISKFIEVDVSFTTSSTFLIHFHHLFQMP